MQVDWFTITAQIVNFLVLIALLKRFLYGPIIKAMDQREERIAERLTEAERREREAQDEARSYREQREELDNRRSQLLREAREEAESRRREMIEEAREEVDELHDRWRDSLRREQHSFLSDMRNQAGREICAITRRIMRDLAGERLEAQMIDVFLNRLDDMDDDERDPMSRAVEHAEVVTVFTAFDLPDDARRKVETAIRDEVAEAAEIHFQTSADLICGIELRTGGYKLAWSVDEYLDALSEGLSQALSVETGEGDGD
jgi:F-type H+-transporting ATPase subunit b